MIIVYLTFYLDGATGAAPLANAPCCNAAFTKAALDGFM
jgi:hypothetical protein